MKCKKCNEQLTLTFESMMIFENVTLFKCSKCETCHFEEELEEEELEKLYWKESE